MSTRTFTPWQPLGSLALDTAPSRPGVFELATLVRTIVYIGAAPDLSAALAQHLSLTGSPYSLGRRYYRFIEIDQPEKLQQRLLDEFRHTHHGCSPTAQTMLPASTSGASPTRLRLATSLAHRS